MKPYREAKFERFDGGIHASFLTDTPYQQEEMTGDVLGKWYVVDWKYFNNLYSSRKCDSDSKCRGFFFQEFDCYNEPDPEPTQTITKAPTPTGTKAPTQTPPPPQTTEEEEEEVVDEEEEEVVDDEDIAGTIVDDEVVTDTDFTNLEKRGKLVCPPSLCGIYNQGPSGDFARIQDGPRGGVFKKMFQ